MKNDDLIAVGYGRVSTQDQIDGYSLDVQETACKEYAKANNMKLVRFFVDGGKSGTKISNRTAYNDMIEYIKSNHIDVVLTHRVDRLHRDEYNAFNALNFFYEHNIQYISVFEKLNSTFIEDKNAISELICSSAKFSRNLSNETRKGLVAGAHQCKHMGGIPPYGYNVNRDTGLLEINTTQSVAVKKIFDLYTEGFSTGDIEKWLTDNKYTTQKGNKFKKNSINELLHNEKYCGTYFWDKRASKNFKGTRNNRKYKENYTRIDGGCPAIVSKETFNKAQERLNEASSKAARRQPNRYYPLNGRIFCECGSRMSGNVQYSGKGENKHKYFQYRCSDKCGSKSIRAVELETEVLKVLESCLFSSCNRDIILDKLNEKAAEFYAESTNQLQELRSKEEGLKNAQERLLSAVERNIAVDSLLKKIERNDIELVDIQKRIKLLETDNHKFTEDEYYELQKAFLNYMLENNTVNAKILLNVTLKSVDVSTKDVVINFNPGLCISNETFNFFN